MVRITNNEDAWMSRALKLEAENAGLRNTLSLLGHVVVVVGGEVIIPRRNIRECPHPLMTREDRPATDDIRLKAILAPARPTTA